MTPDLHLPISRSPNLQFLSNKKSGRAIDKDGDGKLSEEERTAVMQKRKDMYKKFDADGDGKLNVDERKKLHESMKKKDAK